MPGINDNYTYTRDITKDILPTVYTDSTTLITGMTLYDNTGTDTSYVVGNINNNSFDRGVNVSFQKSSNVNTYTIDNTTYTTNYTVPVSLNGIHTLSVTPNSMYSGGIVIDNYSPGLTTSCNFTINYPNIIFNNTYTTNINSLIVIDYGGGSAD